MNTTSVLAELLVIGVFSLSWLYPFATSIFSEKNITPWLSLDIKSLIVVLPILYFCGILMNFLSDIILTPIDNKIAERYGGKKKIIQIRTKIFKEKSIGPPC